MALTELELDALTELVNLGVSRAAHSLAQMVHEEILLSVPKVALVSRDEAIRALGEREKKSLVAVHQAFEGDIALTGSAYTYTAGTPVIPLDSAHNGTVSVSGGDLVNAVTETATISNLNKLVVTKTTSTLTVNVTTLTGLISGTVKANGTTAALPYSGVVLQKTNTGAGVVKGSTATSLIELKRATP